MTKLPDGSGCFTATILSNEEIAKLPLMDRPISHRISSEMYHAVWEAVGAASQCWNPKPSDETFESEKASQIAVDLCFKIANEIENRLRLEAGTLKDPMDDPEYQAFVDKLAQVCKCSHDKPCDGLLAGGMCDNIQSSDERDES